MGKWHTVNVHYDSFKRLKVMAESSNMGTGEILDLAINILWEKAASPEGYTFARKLVVKGDEI